MPTCPSCALYHPSRYEECISCGVRLLPDGAQPEVESLDQTSSNPVVEEGEIKQGRGLPGLIGIGIAAIILCASAGGTYYYLTKPPETERLLQQGQAQLANGQYAFAMKTLSNVVVMDPKNARAQLALARAYVGIDQVEKAWECIQQAQQLGSGIVAEPQLASDLASYYRQRNQFDKAVELLRPLAEAGIPRKKGELSDLDAMWGDEALRNGDLKTAMRCWEEVRQLGEGSRFVEAESRLATIYQKTANEMITRGQSDDALKYLSKLNVFAPNPASYEKAADLYDRAGKLDLAVDQMRRATKLVQDPILNRKLAQLLNRYGKELLDKGEAETGLGYLQQAQSLDPRIRVPSATVRNVRVQVDSLTGQAHLLAEAWNPGPNDVNFLSVKGEVYDTKASKSLWNKEQHVIDEFNPPLPARESKAFELVSAIPVKNDGTMDFRVYLNGALYKAYSIGVRKPSDRDLSPLTTLDADDDAVKPIKAVKEKPEPVPVTQPQPAPSTIPTQPVTSTTPPVAPTYNAPPTVTTPPATGGGLTPEEKTLRDLD